MKRRNVLKTLTLIPFAGGAIQGNSASATQNFSGALRGPINPATAGVEITLESFM